MIVQRCTFQVKGRQRRAAAELARAERERIGATFRIYLSYLGRYDTIVTEYEFEDLGAMETFWSEWFADPESAAFLEKWNNLLEAPRTNEVWIPVE